MTETIIKACLACGRKLSFARVSKDMGTFLRGLSPSLTKKNTPDYCRKCYAPDRGIDKR